jgi:hypothetical protein
MFISVYAFKPFLLSSVCRLNKKMYLAGMFDSIFQALIITPHIHCHFKLCL